ncbi:hypothetical protein QAD02_024444 [Eretmocerus hayati]|uniref:Uncharacterized protein n=1 Tax=Eretmocerus hayati TaxID=131215 RepID=A0ACC2PZD3_9HYME|nr:hypothetical protein QAD02_024444 [Eretmocerus hayati]
MMGKFDDNYLSEKDRYPKRRGRNSKRDNNSSFSAKLSDASASSLELWRIAGAGKKSSKSSRSSSRQRRDYVVASTFRRPGQRESSCERSSRLPSRAGGRENDDEDSDVEEEGNPRHRKSEAELLQEILTRRLKRTANHSEAAAQMNRALLERLLMKNANSCADYRIEKKRAWSANTPSRILPAASLSVGGTPICLRKKPLKTGQLTTQSSRFGRNGQIYPFESTSSLKDMTASELALMKADREVDLKYAQLLMETERVLLSARRQLLRAEVNSGIRASSSLASTADNSPFRKPLTNKRLELIRNGELTPLRNRNSQPELSSGSIRDLLEHSSPKRLLQMRQIALEALHERKCCDPFNKHSKKIKTNLFKISQGIHNTYKHGIYLIPGFKLCLKCLYDKLPSWLKENSAPMNESPDTEVSGLNSESTIYPSQSSDSSAKLVESSIITEATTQSINSLLGVLEIDNKFEGRNVSKRYLNDVYEDIKEPVRKKLRVFDPNFQTVEEQNANDIKEMTDQVIERLKTCRTNAERCFALSVLPKSWTTSEIVERIGVTRYLAEKSIKIAAENGILYKPSVKSGKKIDPSTITLIRNFYESDDVSRVMPGKNDCKSYKVDDVKEKHQKKLLLGNLREIYYRFKECNPNVKVGFSRFAMERPLHCIIAGGAGTHSVCVCKMHQNMKLLLDALNLRRTDPENNWDYQYVLSRMTCPEATEDCYHGKCTKSPPMNGLLEEIEDLLEQRGTNEIIHKQWLQTDRCNLETLSCSVSEVLDHLEEELPKLLRHDFIAKNQASFMKKLKESLSFGHVLVQVDFSENLSSLVQDAVPGYYWSNNQATLHPWVCYWIDSDGNIQHLTVIMISDNLSHDVNTIYAFQQDSIKLLKEKIPVIRKIIYCSDGARGQYKNRFNFLNLAFHKRDFGIPAEWHFFATSHGKGPCDGVGGTLKRAVSKAIYRGLLIIKLFLWRILCHGQANGNLTSSAVTFQLKQLR